MTRRLLVPPAVAAAVLLGASSAAASGVSGNKSAEAPAPSPATAGAREAYGRSENGVWRVTSIPSGSGFRQGSLAPETCDYATDETESDVPFLDGVQLTDADVEALDPERAREIEFRDVTTEVVLNDGAYRYEEVIVDRTRTDQEFVDRTNDTVRDIDLGSYGFGNTIADAVERLFTPLDETFRRFRVFCMRPDGSLDDSQYDNFVDVSAFDPAFGLRAHLTQLYNHLDPPPMTIRQPEQVNLWTGLVVRSPTWLAVGADDWQTTEAASATHNGWRTSMLATPTALTYLIDFQPTEPDAQHLAWTGRVPCLGDVDSDYPLTVGTAEVPAEPFNILDWSEPGSPGACMWTPPARGNVTITAEVTYTITALTTIYGQTSSVAQPPYTRTVGSVSYYAGELRAVNVNDTDS